MVLAAELVCSVVGVRQRQARRGFAGQAVQIVIAVAIDRRPTRPRDRTDVADHVQGEVRLQTFGERGLDAVAGGMGHGLSFDSLASLCECLAMIEYPLKEFSLPK